MMVLVTYDIPDDRRRGQVHKLLKGYGIAVQRSVFECDLARGQIDLLLKRTGRLIVPVDDDFRLYPLCARCHGAGVHLGAGPTGEQPTLLVL